MSNSAYVVMPVGVGKDGTAPTRQETARMASAIQHSVYEHTHPKPPPPALPPRPEEKGPLKEILAHQDSLYKYISWEDPVRTMSSYLIILSLVSGFHFMPLTLWALKAGAYTFGAVSVAEFASRSFGPDTFLSRMRPRPYRKVPERFLNAALKDVHDLTQYGVVQGQKILFGQDLDKTFAAFLLSTALYFLVQLASPFTLSLTALTLLYLSPLVTSPAGRQLASAVAHDSGVLAGDIASKAVDSGKSAIDSGKSLASSAMDRGQNLASSAMDRGQSLAHSTVESSKSAIDSVESGKSMATSTIQSGQNLAHSTVESSKSAMGRGRELADEGMATVSGQTAKAHDSVSDASGRMGAAASNVVGAGSGQGEKRKHDTKPGSEDESNYVVDRKPRVDSPSSIPRASQRMSHPTEAATQEDHGRKTHVYSDPLNSRT
ncbi:hypothetical protein QBC34DRAFT_382488 [Podospora aff. communis PSN243]|uniref:Reticulon domain-containing protein n=1 Tax=Podospora aff. communis PSN243 TaxID=3040156 RepID=A0AAV9GIQ1_9PEZI|nr:hypothetical protein QBC34DRAFT_382488 [Podospora aff. communis PSN243]